MPSDNLFPYLLIYLDTKSNSFALKRIGSKKDVKILNKRKATSCFTSFFLPTKEKYVDFGTQCISWMTLE